MSKPETWIAQVHFLHGNKTPFWIGTFPASGREDAKRACRQGVSAHLAGDYRILRIARGRIDIHFLGKPIDVDDPA